MSKKPKDFDADFAMRVLGCFTPKAPLVMAAKFYHENVSVPEINKLLEVISMYEAALEKIKAGPGMDMVGWKSTWAHSYSDKMLTKIRALLE